MTTRSFSGKLVLIVGPSGAGKDTLIDYAKNRLQHEHRIHFVRRVIARPASVGEDHEPVVAEEFLKLVENGAFALHWDAHGLNYGLPRIIDEWLDKGYVVVANGSRAILAEARRRYATLLVISITALPSAIAERLEKRGREGSEARKARISRTAQIRVDLGDALTIDNSGELWLAGDRLVEALRGAMSGNVHGTPG